MPGRGMARARSCARLWTSAGPSSASRMPGTPSRAATAAKCASCPSVHACPLSSAPLTCAHGWPLLQCAPATSTPACCCCLRGCKQAHTWLQMAATGTLRLLLRAAMTSLMWGSSCCCRRSSCRGAPTHILSDTLLCLRGAYMAAAHLGGSGALPVAPGGPGRQAAGSWGRRARAGPQQRGPCQPAVQGSLAGPGCRQQCLAPPAAYI